MIEENGKVTKRAHFSLPSLSGLANLLLCPLCSLFDTPKYLNIIIARAFVASFFIFIFIEIPLALFPANHGCFVWWGHNKIQ